MCSQYDLFEVVTANEGDDCAKEVRRESGCNLVPGSNENGKDFGLEDDDMLKDIASNEDMTVVLQRNIQVHHSFFLEMMQKSRDE